MQPAGREDFRATPTLSAALHQLREEAGRLAKSRRIDDEERLAAHETVRSVLAISVDRGPHGRSRSRIGAGLLGEDSAAKHNGRPWPSTLSNKWSDVFRMGLETPAYSRCR